LALASYELDTLGLLEFLFFEFFGDNIAVETMACDIYASVVHKKTDVTPHFLSRIHSESAQKL
jgi:hypothetical protein